MVGQHYGTCSMLAGCFGEEAIACFSGCCFHRGLPFGGKLTHIAFSELAGKIEILGEFLHKGGIRLGGFDAKSVIEMGNHKVPASRLKQEMKQGDRVGPTRHGND